MLFLILYAHHSSVLLFYTLQLPVSRGTPSFPASMSVARKSKAKKPSASPYVAGRGGYYPGGSNKRGAAAIVHNEACEACGLGGMILCCDGCNLVYHLECLNPPLTAEPPEDRKWFCPHCVAEQAPRAILENVSTLEDVVEAISKSRSILVSPAELPSCESRSISRLPPHSHPSVLPPSPGPRGCWNQRLRGDTRFSREIRGLRADQASGPGS